ncbi:hypothetical protein E2C01_082093 [Portunus trituberculatus]|uniref:Uncharacterized protein n=1 Tax=Portunus trituberculatus TaxID=210409 RepID=A0A5B7IZV7_PORTR|nr:hypothetical protein [Portunus trituberculatus]
MLLFPTVTHDSGTAVADAVTQDIHVTKLYSLEMHKKADKCFSSTGFHLDGGEIKEHNSAVTFVPQGNKGIA